MLANSEYIVYNINIIPVCCVYMGMPRFTTLVETGELGPYLFMTLIS